MSTSATPATSNCCPPVCCFPLPQGQTGPQGPAGPRGPQGPQGPEGGNAAAFDSFRCLCIAQLQNFLNAFVECVENAENILLLFDFVAGPTNFVTTYIRADIDYRNRILIPVFNDPPTGQPPDRFINLFNVAAIFTLDLLTEEQLACIYTNMRNNNSAGQFRLGGCEAQINRQLVNRLRALQGEVVNIFVAEISGPGEVELVLPGVVVIEDPVTGVIGVISLCDIESIERQTVTPGGVENQQARALAARTEQRQKKPQ